MAQAPKTLAPQEASNIQQAAQPDNPAALYQSAVQLAEANMGAGDDDSDFRKEIDRIFTQELGGQQADLAGLRGENPLMQLGHAVTDGFDFITEGLGTAADGLWDSTIGELFGQGAKDLFTADDAAGLFDLATTIGLSFIPGVGIPLAAGKTLAANTDNIAEAFGGRDVLTREQLSDEERLFSGLAAGADTALSALPGVGRAATAGMRTGGRNAAKEIAENAGQKVPQIKNLDGTLSAGTRVRNAANRSANMQGPQINRPKEFLDGLRANTPRNPRQHLNFQAAAGDTLAQRGGKVLARAAERGAQTLAPAAGGAGSSYLHARGEGLSDAEAAKVILGTDDGHMSIGDVLGLGILPGGRGFARRHAPWSRAAIPVAVGQDKEEDSQAYRNQQGQGMTSQQVLDTLMGLQRGE